MNNLRIALLRGREAASVCAVGDRVETHPGTDAWAQGDRFGEVITVGRKLVHVRMERSGRVRRFHPTNIGQVVEG